MALSEQPKDNILPEFNEGFLPVEKLGSLTDPAALKIFERGREETGTILEETVLPIIRDVEKRGDAALRDYTEKFDGPRLDALLVTSEEFDAAEDQVEPELKAAFKEAWQNIHDFHKAVAPRDASHRQQENEMGLVHRPVDSCAIYVPGGKALYPSTVLMGTVPAQIAGVKNIILITPPRPDGTIAPVVLWCARLAGVTKILKAGGAQAMAAVAFGTDSVEPVDLVVGPGNIFVTLAKTWLAGAGYFGLDSPAGPSEVVIIADDSARPDWVAADLLAQAEHDEKATSILLTNSRDLAEQTRAAVYKGIQEKTGRGSIKWGSIRDNGHIFLVEDLDLAYAFSNRFAPEHLEIMMNDPQRELDKITAAGSVFLGHHAPVAVGDYYSGPNHVLPTGGAGRFHSGLSVASFMKRITWQHISPAGLKKSVEPIRRMSLAEGLYEEHGQSVEIRFSDD